MAYAAVISVFNAMNHLLESPLISVTSSNREILQPAYDEAWLRSTLGLKWCSQVMTASDEQTIIEGARRLEDAIEFTVSTQLLEQSKSCLPTFRLNLNYLKKDVHSFAEMAKKMKARIEELWEQKAAKVIEQHIMETCVPQEEEEQEEEDVSASTTDMVGLFDEFQAFKYALAQPLGPKTGRGFMRVRGFRAILYWISGMAGVGKTTFVQRLYNDPLVRANYECWAFVRVGLEYREERVLRSLYAQLNQKMIKEGDIRKSLGAMLKSKRSLVVLDDVWDDRILKCLLQLYEVNCWGKCILVTSRMEQKIQYSEPGMILRFLNEEESWELLRRKVFGEEQVCPPQLAEHGRRIAKKCGGLPLLINALAPLLLQKADKNPESWNKVADKPYSLLEEASYQISEVLLSSYYHLHEIYKLYFLYITAFPESYVVFCSTINNLLYAEGFHGFIVHDENICPTMDNWKYHKSYAFKVLVESNLVISVQRKSWSSYEVKSCNLHCAYWYVNKRVAKNNRLLYIMNSYADAVDEAVENHHRLAIQTNVLLAIKEAFDNIASISTIRSVLCTGPYHQYQVPVCFEWKLLRVLDVATIRFYTFPVEVVKLVLLRYLALTCNANLTPSISKLWNLQFLIIHQHWRIKRIATESFVPVEIWDLQELVHLEITGRNLPEPPHPGAVLPNLTKILDVGVESCSKGVLGNIPKLKKLRIQIELAPGVAEHLSCFSDVESFQCVVINPTLLRPPPPLSVPILAGIKKLSLSGFGYPWEEMSKIANLENLRVLKLQSYAFRGEKWEVNEEMRFRNLGYLYIEDTDLMHWTKTAEKNMLGLRGLKMKNCYKLHEIPRLPCWHIELIDCNPLAETSAKQKHSSNKQIRVTATYSWKNKKLK